jgi:hypothetical protein
MCRQLVIENKPRCRELSQGTSSIWFTSGRRRRGFQLKCSSLSQELREFFGAFFVLPFKQWGGFLSNRLLEPFERLTFGLGCPPNPAP